MALQAIGINSRNWVDSVQDTDYWRALVNAALSLRIPYAMELVSWLGEAGFWEVSRFPKSPPLNSCQGTADW